jgi:hypothetical protein
MTTTDDRTEIQRVVQTYLDGLYDGDTAKLAQAFHPTSALTSSDNGQVKIVPRDAWLEVVKNRPSPRSQGLARHDEIVTIDVTDDRTALVKLRCAIPPRFFTDYLSLLKIDGRWQVAQKVFTTEVR